MIDSQLTGSLLGEKNFNPMESSKSRTPAVRKGAKDRDIDRKQGEERNAAVGWGLKKDVDDVGW
jgi:hypothetical protein